MTSPYDPPVPESTQFRILSPELPFPIVWTYSAFNEAPCLFSDGDSREIPFCTLPASS